MPSFEAQMIGTKQNKLELQDFAGQMVVLQMTRYVVLAFYDRNQG